MAEKYALVLAGSPLFSGDFLWLTFPCGLQQTTFSIAPCGSLAKNYKKVKGACYRGNVFLFLFDRLFAAYIQL